MTTIITVLTSVFEAMIMLMFINTYAGIDEERKHFINDIFAVVTLAVMITISNSLLNFTGFNVFFFWLSTFVVSFVYNRRTISCLVLSLISLLIMSITEVMTLFLITTVANISAELVVTNVGYRILGITLSKLFAFIIFKILCVKHESNNIFFIKSSYWILFIMVFIITVMNIFLIFKFQLEFNSEELYDFSVICLFGLLFSTFFSLYLYENMSMHAEIDRNHTIIQEQIRSQSKHLDEVLMTQNEIKKLKHDLSMK